MEQNQNQINRRSVCALLSFVLSLVAIICVCLLLPLWFISVNKISGGLSLDEVRSLENIVKPLIMRGVYLMIVGFLVFPIVGLVLGIIGLKSSKRGLAITGVVINGLPLLLVILFLVFALVVQI